MAFEMTDVGKPLTAARVSALEEELAISLPDSYRAFLLRYNGGRPMPGFFPIHGSENNPFGNVHYFFGVDGSVASNSIDWNHEIYRGRLPDELLAIAGDGSGNLICLSLSGTNREFVIFLGSRQRAFAADL